MSVNKVILIGRLGRDPELRYTQGGTAVANFTLATDESYKDKSGEKQKKTEWHRIVAWGKTAELCSQYLTKGREVYLEGRLQTQEWEKEGVKRKTTEIVAQSVQFLGGRSGGQESGTASRPAPDQKPESGVPDFSGGGVPPDDDDGLPF